jgi:hypothetical protein
MNKLTTQEIEMFSKATDIQEMWQPDVGDWFIFDRNDFLLPVVCVKSPTIIYTETPIDRYVQKRDRKWDIIIWIPSQEQMQNMVEPAASKVHNIDIVHLYYPRMSGWTPDVFPSMRLLWLAFVMWRIFDKVWYANEWCVYDEGSGNVLLPDGRIE